MANELIWSTDPASQNLPGPTLPTELQQYIRGAFWPQSRSSIVEYASYFKYFQWSISIISWPHNHFDKGLFAAQSYADLARFVKSLNSMANYSRASIALELKQEFPYCSDAQILRSMEIAVRLWLMLNVRSEDFPVGPSLSYISETAWPERTSLKTLIEDTFFPDSLLPNSHSSRIDPTFTVRNLRKLCRVKIQWTGNLRDHLSYDHLTATLYLFPHKICLISHLESCEVFPKDLLVDTIKTLDLLFPLGEESTHRYLDEIGQSFHRTSSRVLYRATSFEEFRYWRKRLVELHDVYNQTPGSLFQLWHDRRNPIQWWTFWLAAAIALMTVIFGVIGSYTGFRQVSIAQKSYELAVSQACSQENPPKFCAM